MATSSAAGVLSPSLHVLGVDPEVGFAGGQSQVLGLTIALNRAGHRAELLCDPAGALWGRAGAAGVACHALAIRNAVDWVAGFKMRRRLARERYDLVHFHTARAHALAPFARGLGAALVVTRRMDYAPNQLLAPYLYNRAVDRVAAISGRVAEALERAGVARERIRIIPSGVDCEYFRPPSKSERAAARAALGLSAQETAIGSVGMLERRKGHQCLVEAMARLRAEGLRPRCFIAGEGAEHGALAARIEQLGLDGSVVLLGALPDPRRLLWALDIFAFPSRQEGLGVALLEAMACGVAPVATSSGGPAEVIQPPGSGMLVAPGDPAELARALSRLARAPELRIEVAQAARARIVESFGLDATVRQTLELYQDCLRVNRPARAEAAGSDSRCRA